MKNLTKYSLAMLLLLKGDPSGFAIQRHMLDSWICMHCIDLLQVQPWYTLSCASCESVCVEGDQQVRRLPAMLALSHLQCWHDFLKAVVVVDVDVVLAGALLLLVLLLLPFPIEWSMVHFCGHFYRFIGVGCCQVTDFPTSCFYSYWMRIYWTNPTQYSSLLLSFFFFSFNHC